MPSIDPSRKHTWHIYYSYFREWRWEERDQHHRVVRESNVGFDSFESCVLDTIKAQAAVEADHL